MHATHRVAFFRISIALCLAGRPGPLLFFPHTLCCPLADSYPSPRFSRSFHAWPLACAAYLPLSPPYPVEPSPAELADRARRSSNILLRDVPEPDVEVPAALAEFCTAGLGISSLLPLLADLTTAAPERHSSLLLVTMASTNDHGAALAAAPSPALGLAYMISMWRREAIATYQGRPVYVCTVCLVGLMTRFTSSFIALSIVFNGDHATALFAAHYGRRGPSNLHSFLAYADQHCVANYIHEALTYCRTLALGP